MTPGDGLRTASTSITADLVAGVSPATAVAAPGAPDFPVAFDRMCVFMHPPRPAGPPIATFWGSFH